MLKNTGALLTGALLMSTLLTSCSKYDKTESGLEYKIEKDSAGDVFPEKGGFMTFWFQIRNDKDSILDNQFLDPNPVGIPVPEVTHEPSIEEGFALLTDGDSAVFLLDADSLYINSFHSKRPDYIKAGSKIKMIVRMGKVYSKKFVDSVMTSQADQEKALYTRDSVAIQTYLTEHKLTGQATIGGAYVVKLKENNRTDIFIQPMDTVKTSYVGKLLIEGTEFDKSQPGQPFAFVVGMGQVIKGWDEGFMKLKRGEKALILIPSRIAYGSRGAGGAIPPNAPLLFEVEVSEK